MMAKSHQPAMTESVKLRKPLFGAASQGTLARTIRFATLRWGEFRLCWREKEVSPFPSRFPKVSHVELQLTLVNRGRPPT